MLYKYLYLILFLFFGVALIQITIYDGRTEGIIPGEGIKTKDDLEPYKSRSQEELEAYKTKIQKESETYKAKIQKESEAYKVKVRKEIEAYKSKIRMQWQFAEIDTPYKLVIYSKNDTNKLVIDYKTNEIRFSSLEPERNTDQAVDFIVKSLKTPIASVIKQNKFTQNATDLDLNIDALLTLAQSWGYSDSELKKLALRLTAEKNSVSEFDVVKQVIGNIGEAQQKLANLESNDQYIKTLKKEKYQYQNLLNLNQKKVKSHSYQVKLNIPRWQKSKPYRTNITEYATRWNLPEDLVYATIETESNFNPRAQSLAPAFGLMQIVPKSAGADVWEYLNDYEGYPSAQDLFIPSTNIMYGSVYFHLLLTDYFSNVKNPISRLYCSIAGYNTGPGNVAATFNGGTNKELKNAINIINTMDPEEVKGYLIKKLPYHETRRYLTKVLDAQKYYAQQLNT